jgi:hypothetical protein
MNTKLNKIIYSHINDGLTGNGNRSSKRTDKLHNGILECIKNELPDFDKKYNVFHEKAIKCAWGNKFKIDILIEDKVGNIVCCILLKAYISSVQKNRANIAGNSYQEFFRIKGIPGRKNVKVWFITLIANETPSYKNDGTLRNMERTETSYVPLNKIDKRKNVFYSTIKYDLMNIDYSTKDTFKNTLNENNIKNITENTLINNAKRIL